MAAIRLNWDVLIVIFLLMGLFSGFSWAVDAPVLQSGQTTSYGTRDDGVLQKGTPWLTSRFSDLGDGTVFDTLTRLIWMKNANCWGEMAWANAITKITDLNNSQTTCSGYNGHDTDWRLPNRKEMKSLIDYGRSNPALPSGHPFTGVQSNNFYWSSTTHAVNTTYAWLVFFNYGHVGSNVKASSYYVWPIRGGQ